MRQLGELLAGACLEKDGMRIRREARNAELPLPLREFEVPDSCASDFSEVEVAAEMKKQKAPPLGVCWTDAGR